MFAAVEFLGKEQRRELAIVPLIWLADDRTYCNWPKIVKSEADFERLVKTETPFQKSWKKHSVHRVLETSEDYDTLTKFVNSALNEGTTEEGSDQVFEVTKKLVVEQDSDNAGRMLDSKRKKRHHKSSSKKKSKKPRKDKSSSPISLASTSQSSDAGNSESSSSSDDEPDHDESRRLKQQKRSRLEKSASQINSSAIDKENNGTPRGQKSTSNQDNSATEPLTPRVMQESQNRNRILHTPQSTGSSRIATVRSGFSSDFQRTVLDYLVEIKAEQDKNNEMLAQILHNTQTTLRGPEKPDAVPNLPIEDLHVFELFDEKLVEDAIKLYIQNRLLSVGGTDLRSVVMGMMREMMTDTLATRFNWKGHYVKKSFERTNLQSIIRETTKRYFRKKMKATDREIISAIQDWLKQAKNRLVSRRNKD